MVVLAFFFLFLFLLLLLSLRQEDQLPRLVLLYTFFRALVNVNQLFPPKDHCQQKEKAERD